MIDGPHLLSTPTPNTLFNTWPCCTCVQNGWSAIVKKILLGYTATGARGTLLQDSTLYEATAHSNGLSLQSISRFSDLQGLIKALTYEHSNVVLTQPFTGVI
ncbi:hypothetical protein TNCV_2166701 [Trichonephila clavipes]|nr:hypothetical protein TNCV_2166701 [Trichonephila clavipes]